MKIQIAGPGCPRCQMLEQNVFNACAELGLAADITHITEVKEFAKLGVMMTPALIVNDKIAAYGKVPSVAELKKILLRPKSKAGNKRPGGLK